MIKQILSRDIKKHLEANSKCILLDIRMQEEVDTLGKPDGDKLGIKTYFLPMEFDSPGIVNKNFLDKFKNLPINKENQILTICAAGIRSQFAAELLTKENYICVNISDGFSGNDENPGWQYSDLPCK